MVGSLQMIAKSFLIYFFWIFRQRMLSTVDCNMSTKTNITMFKNALSSIDGVSVFPIFSLIVFFVFFSALGFWVYKADKKYVKYMKNLPFDKEK